MKEGETSSPLTTVKPRTKRRRGGTDFSNRKARQRKEARRMVEVDNNIPRTPVKGRVGGPSLGLRYRSIRKLNLEDIEEREVDIVVGSIDERELQNGNIIEGAAFEMSGGRRLEFEDNPESPQPPIKTMASPLAEIEDDHAEEEEEDDHAEEQEHDGEDDQADGAAHADTDQSLKVGSEVERARCDGAGEDEGCGEVSVYDPTVCSDSGLGGYYFLRVGEFWSL